MSTDRTAEILNYLSAMSREIGESRTETKQQFAEVNARLEKLETEVREIRADIRKMNYEFDEFAIDTTELRAEPRDLRKRTEVPEKGAGITDSV